MTNPSAVSPPDYEWDPSQTHSTNWLASQPAPPPRGRAYGRRSTNNVKVTTSTMFPQPPTISERNKKRALRRRDDNQMSTLDASEHSLSSINDDFLSQSLHSPRAGTLARQRSYKRASSGTSSLSRSSMSSLEGVEWAEISTSTLHDENCDPNIQMPKKPKSEVPSKHGTPMSPTFSNSTPQMSSSFSSLAKSQTGWAAHASTGSIAAQSREQTSLSLSSTSSNPVPPVSPSTPSRKRSVCRSPLLSADDTLSFSVCTSTSRGRARSRLFSPPREEPNLLDDGESACEIYDANFIDQRRRVAQEEETEFEMMSSPDHSTSSSSSAGNLLDKSLEDERREQVQHHHILTGPPVPERLPLAFEPPSSIIVSYLLISLRKLVSLPITRMCMVSPKRDWNEIDKATFLHWGVGLGLALRSGGCGVAFLVCRVDKAREIINQLEDDLRSIDDEVGESPAVVIEDERGTVEGIKLTKPPLFHVSIPRLLSEKKPPRPLNCFPTNTTPISRKLTPQLLTALDNLKILDSKNNQEIECVLDTDSNKPDPPLVRTVTLEQSPHENKIIKDHRPRHSGEHAIDNNEFMRHCHGISPLPRGVSPVAPKDISPFVRQPMCFNSVTKSVDSGGSSFVETPMPRRSNNFWSNCGKDWGQSQPCPNSTIAVLLRQLEDDSECYESGIDDYHSYNPSESPLIEAQTLHCNVKTSDLGFDEEVEEESVEVETEPTQSGVEDKAMIRRNKSMAKHARVSIGTASFNSFLPPPRPSSYYSARPLHLSQLRESISTGKQDIFSTSFHGSTVDDEKASRSFGLMSCALTCFSPSISESPMKKPLFFVKISQATEPSREVFVVPPILHRIFEYATETELLFSIGLVNKTWADTCADVHASLLLRGFEEGKVDGDDGGLLNMKSWSDLNESYPWGCFLSEGAFKKVYKVWNVQAAGEQAVSVMDVDLIDSTGNKETIGAELAVSTLLSSLVRRNICPNFVSTHSVFTCEHPPASSHWGSADRRQPKGASYTEQRHTRPPRAPKVRGQYQYISMELCRHGDLENALSTGPLPSQQSQYLFFQMAFALHAASDRYGLKHYDVKNLNVLLQSTDATVLRYGVGAHTFALRLPEGKEQYLAKIADYGTANVQSDSNGRPVTLAQFTTLENTPPEYLLLGDAAQQGYGHDCWNLGLCLLHLFTGYGPYEEILIEVVCPLDLKSKLKQLWLSDESCGYDVIKSVILADVYEDENGVVAGEPDEILYDTLYRYLVLFGIPDRIGRMGAAGKIVKSCLLTSRRGKDKKLFDNDSKRFSLFCGNDDRIRDARKALECMEGGVELMKSLTSFDPTKRGTPLGVINSRFMESLREDSEVTASISKTDIVHSYMSFSLK